MTYCVGVMTDAGFVLASDSRTNAGVDNVSTFRKMKIFEHAGDRVIAIVNSGNLAVTQATINLLEQNIRYASEAPSMMRHLMNVHSMWEVAELVGAAMREVRHRDGSYLMQANVDISANYIVAGQIAGEPPRLFMVYSEGNFIEATPETPYFQIGETKYGKPIIDRVIVPETSLDETVKCVLVSFDSTMRSNISVGLPIDLLCYQRNALRVTRFCRLDEENTYIRTLRHEWGEGVRRAFLALPNLQWDF